MFKPKDYCQIEKNNDLAHQAISSSAENAGEEIIYTLPPNMHGILTGYRDSIASYSFKFAIILFIGSSFGASAFSIINSGAKSILSYSATAFFILLAFVFMAMLDHLRKSSDFFANNKFHVFSIGSKNFYSYDLKSNELEAIPHNEVANINLSKSMFGPNKLTVETRNHGKRVCYDVETGIADIFINKVNDYIR